MNKHIKNEPSRSSDGPDRSVADFLASSFVPLSLPQCTKREALKPMLLPLLWGLFNVGKTCLGVQCQESISGEMELMTGHGAELGNLACSREVTQPSTMALSPLENKASGLAQRLWVR